MKEIFKALAAAQKNFEAAKKDAKNPHFAAKYASLDSCMDAVRGPLNDQGIFITQTIESVENGVLIETMFAHESSEVYLGGKLFIPVVKHDAQGYGSAITYGRRYSILAACGVAPEDDDGNSAEAAAAAAAARNSTAVRPPPPPPPADQEDILGKLRDAAMHGTETLRIAYDELQPMAVVWDAHKVALKKAAVVADKAGARDA